MQSITLTAPDDWHVHLRDGDFLKETVPATARCFQRAIVMPNLAPPVVNAEQALAYRQRILEQVPPESDLEPLMTLYLTNQTSPADIIDAGQAGVTAVKLYPAGATTNSDSAVNDIEKLFPIFEALSEIGMPLLIHGEVTDPKTDIFDREKLFIDQHLIPIRQAFPDLKIVFEHITTADAADYVLSENANTAATITPQHLLLNRNDLLSGGIRPHHYCLPVLKRNVHQQRLLEVVASGATRFFLGSDSAPHTQSSKESSCGCAGCYSAWGALELYAQVFDELGALDKLEAFCSFNGPDFYGLARNSTSVTLHRKAWTMPEQLCLPDGSSIIPFYAGQTLNWQLMTHS